MMLFELHNVNIDDVINMVGKVMEVKYGPERLEGNIARIRPNLTYFGNDEYHVHAFNYADNVIVHVFLHKFIEDGFLYDVKAVTEYIRDNLDNAITIFRDWINALHPIIGIVTPYDWPLTETLPESDVDNTLLQKVREDVCGSIAIMYITNEPSIISTMIIKLLENPLPFIVGDISVLGGTEYLKTPKELLEKLSNRCRVEVRGEFAIIRGPQR
ncbi:hypothetical protein VMUT_1482 [Vulcanisaeta moutnovskia 768-28]|uniref:Uncharacterized protein n=1 Tax=Vulcanisaeta moutnovskia (strain 768-28) TaxID=985053 RepID=F0QTH4_VULM7|nr:hypothetical protein [Vulcanisaeta moutnovskia]ADY01687.1 hypothetical protein VMUT_1482 [Vulcanisaeta moutnovskia 768-28]